MGDALLFVAAVTFVTIYDLIAGIRVTKKAGPFRFGAGFHLISLLGVRKLVFAQNPQL